MNHTRQRRLVAGLIVMIIGMILVLQNPANYQALPADEVVHDTELPPASSLGLGEARSVLDELDIKGRAPKTGYARSNFGTGWARDGSCDMRNLVLGRDMQDVVWDDRCRVLSGTLEDPYTAQTIQFVRGSESSQLVQIDHVVSLSDAWQKGAQALAQTERVKLSNDPLNLLAVDGASNQQKGDGDAATWLPPNRLFRCQYVARQIAVKQKYNLWLTAAEYEAMVRVLERCPGQLLPVAQPS